MFLVVLRQANLLSTGIGDGGGEGIGAHKESWAESAHKEKGSNKCFLHLEILLFPIERIVHLSLGIITSSDYIFRKLSFKKSVEKLIISSKSSFSLLLRTIDIAMIEKYKKHQSIIICGIKRSIPLSWVASMCGTKDVCWSCYLIITKENNHFIVDSYNMSTSILWPLLLFRTLFCVKFSSHSPALWP